MSMNLRTIYLPPAPNMCNNYDKNKILVTKLELYGMKYYFCVFQLQQITHKLNKKPLGFTQFVSDSPNFIFVHFIDV